MGRKDHIPTAEESNRKNRRNVKRVTSETYQENSPVLSRNVVESSRGSSTGELENTGQPILFNIDDQSDNISDTVSIDLSKQTAHHHIIQISDDNGTIPNVTINLENLVKGRALEFLLIIMKDAENTIEPTVTFVPPISGLPENFPEDNMYVLKITGSDIEGGTPRYNIINGGTGGGGGSNLLSDLIIDVDKDWDGRSISNLGGLDLLVNEIPNSITNLDSIDFAGPDSTIEGLFNLEFFYENHTIVSTANGLLYRSDSTFGHKFLFGTDDVAPVTIRPHGIDTDDIRFPNGTGVLSSNTAQIGKRVDGNLFLHMGEGEGLDLIFGAGGVTAWEFTENTLIGELATFTNVIIQQFLALNSTVNPITNGAIARVGDDVKIFSGGELRNISEILTNPLLENLQLNNNSIEGVLNIDFDGVDNTIEGLHNLEFFQEDHSIVSTSEGLRYRSAPGFGHKFLFGTSDEIPVTIRPHGIDTDDIRFPNGTGVLSSNTAQIGKRVSNNLFLHVGEGEAVEIIYGSGGDATWFFTDNTFSGELANLKNVIVQQMINFSPNVNPVSDGGISLVNGDLMIFSGGELRNVSDIGIPASIQEEGTNNILSITGGILRFIKDTDVLMAFSDAQLTIAPTIAAQDISAQDVLIRGDLQINGNIVSDLTPDNNNVRLLGDSTHFWSSIFGNRHYFENTNYWIDKVGNELQFSAPSGGGFEFRINSNQAIAILSDGTLDMSGEDITNIEDLEVNGDIILGSGSKIELTSVSGNPGIQTPVGTMRVILPSGDEAAIILYEV